MLRYNLLMIALAGATIAVAIPCPMADAQSRQSLVFAERACLDYGVPPSAGAFASCVHRAARAFDRGEPDIAYQQARLTRDARDHCQSYGIAPETLGYQKCVLTEIDRTRPR